MTDLVYFLRSARLRALAASAVLLAACGDDGGARGDAGGTDASVKEDASTRKDAASGGEDAQVDAARWRCNLNDYGCYCKVQTSRPASQQACDTSGCCILVQREGDGDTCACLSSAGADLRQQTCEAWLDEQVATCEQAECTRVDSCPPGTPRVMQPDASTDAGLEDSGSFADAATDDVHDSSVVPPIPNQGQVQHCVYPEGCFEFRDHRPSCYEGNELNCVSGFSGRYALGKCPQANYKLTLVDQTSCGETGSYVY